MSDQAITPDWWRVGSSDRATPVRHGRLAFAALVTYLVILVAAPQEFVPVFGPVRIALLTGIVALAAHGVDRMSGHVAAPRWPAEIRLTVLLFIWAVATVPFSFWPSGSIEVLFSLYLKSIAVCFLLATVVDSRRRLLIVCTVLVACAIPISITALDHFRLGMNRPGSTNRIEGYGTSALAGNPNDLAFLLNLVIPLTAVLCLSAKTFVRQVVLLGVLALSVAGVVVSFSRGGFIALAVTGLLFLLRLTRRGAILPLVVVVGGALALVMLAPAGYGERLGTVSNIDADATGSAQGRWRDTVLAAQFALRHPLVGAGAGMDFLALNQLRGPAWVSVHNVYLNYAVDLGLLGLGLFLAIFGKALRGVVRVERQLGQRGSTDVLGSLAAGVRISLLAFAAGSFFHPIAYHAYFYLVVGLAVAMARINQLERAQP